MSLSTEHSSTKEALLMVEVVTRVKTELENLMGTNTNQYWVPKMNLTIGKPMGLLVILDPNQLGSSTS